MRILSRDISVIRGIRRTRPLPCRDVIGECILGLNAEALRPKYGNFLFCPAFFRASSGFDISFGEATDSLWTQVRRYGPFNFARWNSANQSRSISKEIL
jgi:hypothetical protein